MTTLHFIRPEWLYALIPLGCLWSWLAWRRSRRSQWEVACDAHLLPYLLTTAQPAHQRLPLTLLALGWLLAVFAMAGPSWREQMIPVYRSDTARVIVFDLSTAMDATDLPPSRLERARYKLIDLLKQTKEGQTALVVFSSEPYVVSPLTQDTRTLLEMVPDLSPALMPVQGQDLSRALTLAAKLLTQAGVTTGDIVVMTAATVKSADQMTAQQLHAKGYRISVLGVGSAKGTPIHTQAGNYLQDDKGAIIISQLDKQGLQQLATAGGGRYADFSNDQSDLTALIPPATTTEKAASEETTTSHRQDDGRWLAILLLPLAACGLRRGWI